MRRMLLRRRRSTPPATAPDEAIPRYPPFLEGIPVTPVARVLDTQTALIERLRQATCLATAAFERLVLPVLSRYAGFVHLLPASETHHHRLTGGLFRHGLEVALLATQRAQGRLFGYGLPPEQRHRLEPGWQLAALLAGLCHDLGKPVTDLRVTSRQGGYT